jgi:7-carboxy-7-deazaguanine synthase
MNSSPEQEPLDAVLTVTEIFKSIQGESTWAGMPCTFVRLTGCNLSCTYCDTAYARDGGTTMTIRAIIECCASLKCDLVEVTGGEPLCRPECATLVACLIERGYTVLVETNGSLPISMLPPAAVTIMDIKCPGSGMHDRTDWSNIEAIEPKDEIKFVIANREDYEWARDVLGKYALAARCKAVLFAPVFGALEPRALGEWIIEDGLNVRLQVQLHKTIWPPDQRGV